MKRGGWLKRFKGLNPVNRKRKAKRHVEAFGPPDFVPFVHAYGCVVAREFNGDWQTAGCSGPVEAAHVRSRGAGGGWRNGIVGLCRAHHREQHTLGVESFDRKYQTDLDLWAAAITGKYEESL